MVKIEQDSSYGQIYKIKLREGEIVLSSPMISRQYYGVYTQLANVHLTSKSKNAVDVILEQGGRPYWTFRWVLSNELNVPSIVSKIEDITGVKPASASSVNGEIGCASYYIANGVRVDISEGMNQRTEVTLVSDAGHPNSGFINVHKLFSPDIILSIVYGEIPKNEINDLVRKSY